jgi:hypothetical protein
VRQMYARPPHGGTMQSPSPPHPHTTHPPFHPPITTTHNASAENVRKAWGGYECARARLTVRCAFSGRNLNSRMPLDPTHDRLKRARV